MTGRFSPLWLSLPSDLTIGVRRCIDEALGLFNGNDSGRIFFRADDIAVPGKRFARLMQLFTTYQVPLSLSVVPSWLTGERWISLQEPGRKIPSFWCWHQHGWRHANHETGGKKQEFGPGRSFFDARKDIIRGRNRLESLMGKNFYPVFTPPWNRCDLKTLEILRELGYVAVSRSRGSKPASPVGLPDIAVNVDLHTRKETDPHSGWDHLFAEIRQAVSSGRCGIMLHHQRMNDAAFAFLEILLQNLLNRKRLQLLTLKDLREGGFEWMV
jgi:hypothetical protein